LEYSNLDLYTNYFLLLGKDLKKVCINNVIINSLNCLFIYIYILLTICFCFW
jgi:hypothetical protein